MDGDAPSLFDADCTAAHVYSTSIGRRGAFKLTSCIALFSELTTLHVHFLVCIYLIYMCCSGM
jgi:hypothetical protein